VAVLPSRERDVG